MMQHITLLTGPAASGKNTAAHLYATRFCERCAVIDGDIVRAMLRQPHAAPWEGDEGLRQHQLGARHVCSLARSFAEQEYEVVALDVLWADLPEIYRTELADFTLKIVRLMPHRDIALARLHARPPSISDEEAHWVYETQVTLRDYDFSIDNSEQSAVVTVAKLSSIIRA